MEEKTFERFVKSRLAADGRNVVWLAEQIGVGPGSIAQTIRREPERLTMRTLIRIADNLGYARVTQLLNDYEGYREGYYE